MIIKVLKIFSEVFKRFLILFIRLYQILLSPVLPPTCRYFPSCSTYSIQALKKYGVIKGLWKSTWRILRCNPFSPGGYDPVEPDLSDHTTHS